MSVKNTNVANYVFKLINEEESFIAFNKKESKQKKLGFIFNKSIINEDNVLLWRNFSFTPTPAHAKAFAGWIYYVSEDLIEFGIRKNKYVIINKNIYSDTFKHGTKEHKLFIEYDDEKEKLISVKVQFYIKDQYETGCIDFEYVKKFALMVLKENSKNE